MRILMLTHNRAWQTGTFHRAFSLAAALTQLGHHVELIAGRRHPGLMWNISSVRGVRILQPPDIMPARIRNSGLSPVEIVFRHRYLKNRTFDVVHGFEHRPTVQWIGQDNRRRGQTIYVKDWADLWGEQGLARDRHPLSRNLLGRWDHRHEQLSVTQADGVTVISRHLLARSQDLHHDPTRIHYLPVGADADQVRGLPKAAARHAANLPIDAKILVYMGFSHHDAPIVIHCLSLLVQLDKQYRLLLIGPNLQSLRPALHRSNLLQHTIWAGQIPHAHLDSWLACGDLMLLPYVDNIKNRARFPHRFGDYLAAGRPIITNSTGDLGAIVNAENIGCAVPASAPDMAAAIATLFSQPKSLEQMGKSARHLAETRLSWRHLACDLAMFYRDLGAP